MLLAHARGSVRAGVAGLRYEDKTMKRTFALMGITLAVCALGWAQDDGRIVVPSRNSTRPRVVEVATSNGSITVRASGGKDVLVKSGSIRSRREMQAPPGMHRIDIPNRGI